MNLRLSMLPCCLMAACCTQEPQSEADQDATSNQEQVTPQVAEVAHPAAAQVAGLPEVRYYLIADT